jgi:DNA-binding response OmpR family regulator
MTTDRLSGRTIRVVEDEPLIALDLKTALRTAGADAVVTRTLNDALDLADRSGWAGAIIDFSLGTSDGGELCRRLVQRGVPFMFYSGQLSDAFNEWPHAPVISKPAATETLVGVLADLIHRANPLSKKDLLLALEALKRAIINRYGFNFPPM